MEIACLDLEGTLVPEIWINVAERTGIADLRITTRDIPDYDELMSLRLEILNRHGLKIGIIQEAIEAMGPLEGAPEFLDWLRERMQVVILSDTFYQFAAPLMKHLGHPALFCHDLEVDSSGKITDYRLRLKDQKRESVKHFHALNFKTIACGDSYNDISMLAEAGRGILFCPPNNVAAEFPHYPVASNFAELRREFLAAQQCLRSGCLTQS